MQETLMTVMIGLLAVNIALLLVLIFRKNAFPDQAQELERQLMRSIREEFEISRRQSLENAAQSRAELSARLTEMVELQSKQLADITRINNENLSRLNNTIEQRMETVRATVEKKLTDIQTDNAAKLESMRQTVDEKLHQTLERRLGESFQAVSAQLEQVHKGLGEMQSLAQGVGDLKKVMTNVKNRGIWGEIQLGNILDQILTPDQYETNIATVPGRRDPVEFAVRMPGKEEGNPVYLPIDSKFPLEKYTQLLEAYDTGDPDRIAAAGKELEYFIKQSAKDIMTKYIAPPHTTDFGILFLPIEGLYAEVVRRTGLLESLQREYHILVTGPTTLSALLNSLQMGFRTVAIEKRSSEVWRILGAVKTEFGKFGEALAGAQRRIQQVSNDLDDLVGTRTRQIIRKLRDVQELPEKEVASLLQLNTGSGDGSGDGASDDE